MHHVNLANFDVPGYDAGIEGVLSFHACQTVCQAVAECKHVTYATDTRLCFLKTSDEGREEEQGHIVSGPKKCQARPEEEPLMSKPGDSSFQSSHWEGGIIYFLSFSSSSSS